MARFARNNDSLAPRRSRRLASKPRLAKGNPLWQVTFVAADPRERRAPHPGDPAGGLWHLTKRCEAALRALPQNIKVVPYTVGDGPLPDCYKPADGLATLPATLWIKDACIVASPFKKKGACATCGPCEVEKTVWILLVQHSDGSLTVRA